MGDMVGVRDEWSEDPGQSFGNRVDPLESRIEELGETQEILSGPGGMGADAGDILRRRPNLVRRDEIPLQRVEEVVIVLVVRLALQLEVEVEFRTQPLHEHPAVSGKDPVRHISHEHDVRPAWGWGDRLQGVGVLWCVTLRGIREINGC